MEHFGEDALTPDFWQSFPGPRGLGNFERMWGFVPQERSGERVSPDYERSFASSYTTTQRRALSRAVTAEYYSIPREATTQKLADEFDISDQAMTERLRRAIVNLVTNTLLIAESGGAGHDA